MGILFILILMFVLLVLGIFGIVWRFYREGKISKRTSVVISSSGFAVACILLAWLFIEWNFFIPSV